MPDPTQSDQSGPPTEVLAQTSFAPHWRNVSPLELVVLTLVAATLGYAYAPNFLSLYRTWNREPDYSHGILVLPIALFILYRLWPEEADRQPRVWLPGFGVLVVGLGLRAWFHSQGQSWSETFTLLLVVFGLGLSRLGPRMMWRVWPAFAFLLFWFPLPPAINSMLSQPLQSIATKAATRVLQFTGLWVMPEGNVIMVGNDRLEVAAACNGLSMLMSLAAAIVATVSLVPMTFLKRLCLLATIVPIALISNVLRISATAWCYHRYGAEIGSRYAHDAAGWLMMPTAMILAGLELAVISWLVIESPVTVTPVSFGATFGPIRSASAGEARR